MDEADLLWDHLDGLGAGLSNQLLPDSEHAIAKKLLILTQAELQEIIADISSNRSPIPALLKRRDELLGRQERLYVATASWKQIPPELLIKILVHSVDGEDGVICLPIRNPPHSWNLLRVCSTWRQVALDEPRIWNRLYIDLDSYNHNNTLKLAHELIGRTKGAVISISLTSTFLRGPEDVVINFIMSYASRIQNLSLRWQQAECSSFFQLPAGSFSSLESLFVAFTNEHLRILANDKLSVFDATPCLRVLVVKFNNWGHLLPSTTLQLPWVQLTDVTFSGGVAPPFAMIFRVLSQCTKLINFTTSFGNNDLSSTSSSDPTPITLPNLRSLTLNVVSTLALFNRLLSPLVAPSFEAFTIHSESGILRWPQWHFLSFIKRSNCSLISLSSPFLIRTGDVEPLLVALPSLVNLSLPTTTIPPEILAAMVRGELLPVLETAELKVASNDAFLDLVEARRSGGNPGYKGITKANVRALDYTGASRDRYKKLKLEYLREGRDIIMNR